MIGLKKTAVCFVVFQVDKIGLRGFYSCIERMKRRNIPSSRAIVGEESDAIDVTSIHVVWLGSTFVPQNFISQEKIVFWEGLAFLNRPSLTSWLILPNALVGPTDEFL